MVIMMAVKRSRYNDEEDDANAKVKQSSACAKTLQCSPQCCRRNCWHLGLGRWLTKHSFFQTFRWIISWPAKCLEIITSQGSTLPRNAVFFAKHLSLPRPPLTKPSALFIPPVFWGGNFSLTHLGGHEALKFSQRNRAETPGVDLGMGNKTGNKNGFLYKSFPKKNLSLQCYPFQQIGDRNTVCRISCFFGGILKVLPPILGGRFTKFSTLIPWVSSLERTTSLAKKRLRNCWSLRPCPRIPCNLRGPGWDLLMIRGKYTKSDVLYKKDELMVKWW